MKPDEMIAELKLALPPAPKAAGLYKPVLMLGDFVYFSGHLPILSDGSMITGTVGTELSIEEGAAAARHVGLSVLSSLKEKLGSLNQISRVVKLLGMVNAPSSFSEHPKVINGCSELFREIWGEDFGVGVRSAFGVSGLPGNASVEIEGIFQLAR
tara:strand:+ start:161 stop:625 length:465 start_codon:yes stop_codon:yes gene_type:complete